jgi:hypothetical protein
MELRSITIVFDLVEKRRGNDAKNNFSHGKEPMNKMLRREELPFVRY